MTVVTTVGLAVMDFVFGVDVRPDRGRKAFASSLAQVGGGPAATAAVTVAALGGIARFVGRIGEDPIGDHIMADLDRWHVDTGGIRRVPDASSPVSSIVVEPDGERTIVNYTDPRLHGPDDVVTAADLEGSDAVLVDMRWPVGSRSALVAATDLGVPSILDFDEAPEWDVAEALRLPNYVLFSAPALAGVTGSPDPEEALRRVAGRTAAWVGVTLGAEGMMWLDDGTMVRSPAYTVVAVDTLGAGDVYHGAFALGIAEGREIHDVVRRAAAVAALKCTRFGGREGIPSIEEVESFMEDRLGGNE